MAEQDYSKNALANFTHEAASGGAIRHLADLGYTVDQIAKQLTFPTPLERVRREVWERLLDTGVVLLEEPGNGNRREKPVFVEERDQYGRTSFRRVAMADGLQQAVLWKECSFKKEETQNQSERKSKGVGRHQSKSAVQEKGRCLAAFLAKKCGENGEEESYCSCRFGLMGRKDSDVLAASMELLDERQREYIQGLPWENKICYHRLDARMREIVVRLYGQEKYSGVFYFLKTEEKIRLDCRKYGR